MNKPTKPTTLVPRQFGGVKNNFSQSLQNSGYEDGIPAIYGGDNLNYQLDATGKEFDYCEKIVDFIIDMPIGKTITTDDNNNLVYDDLRQSLPVATKESLGVVQIGDGISVDDDGVISAYVENYLIKSNINGSNWYRQYRDGWIEQGGIITSTATNLPWGQPRFQSNASSNSGNATSIGTMGGTSFAVSCSHIGNSKRPLSSAFNGIIPETANMREAYSVAHVQGNASLGGNWIKIYSPTPILLSELDVYWASLSTAARTTTLIVKATNNGSDPVSNWDLLSEGTTSTSTAGGGNIPIKHIVDLGSNQNYYQYFYIQNTTPFAPFQAMYNVWYVAEVKLIATYTTSASSGDIEFPLDFSDTNYTALLGFEGASGSNTYISSKTNTGFSLGNAPTGNVNWYACGY